MFVYMDQVYMQSAIEFSISVIKTVFLILCIFYTNFKITDEKIKFNFDFLKKSVMVLIYGITFGIIKAQINIFISIFASVLIISIIFSKNKIINSIITTVISFSINYPIWITTTVICFAFYAITKNYNNYINLAIMIINHIVLLHLFLKIKRFRKGFSF